jgi:catechol 2,3-dioxygenase-like lactoylglutathione lyase family enzyme
MSQMKQSIGLVALVVREYDEAIDFYVGTLSFSVVEDTYIPDPAHTVGKLHTQQLERKPLTLRTRLQRLARNTIGFSTSVFLPDTGLGLLVHRDEFGAPVSISLSTI